MLKKAAGFTLIELIVTMVILAIVAAVAVPGFGNLIEGNRLVSGTNLVASSIKFARAEAIKRGASVTFSTEGDLATGWCVHTGDANGDCTNNQIRGFEPPRGLAFTETVSDLVFDRRGFLLPQVTQELTIYPEDCTSGDASFRRIRISPVGRTEIDDDGVCP
ncbi:GspH/FimT family pseudopilin [Marinobacter sp. 1-4A]|uniref:GspH/FimT family pseudopilin n=1 Tax=Marinobacter sp. 1-4A TaxID=2582919 RepID=UPI0019045116|nr:GspH/FimT family pseudopilin [Marinobacter sp. 1-4A]MBK1852827.1 GspH/FimT family pseudopilin [Marinobacter sp. 1-4A]